MRVVLFHGCSGRGRSSLTESSEDVADTEAQQFSDEVLEQTPGRVTTLLSAIGAVANIRRLMALAGMKGKDIVEGRSMLLDTLATATAPEDDTDSESAKKARQAEAEVDNWDEYNFTVAHSALGRFYPNAEEYLFRGGLKASTGVEAVEGVATFLARLAALEDGTDDGREATREQDVAAVAKLAERGITKEVRDHLQSLVELALGPTDAEPVDDTPVKNRRAKLTALKIWYDDWATMAKAKIRKRSYLIRMGLAKRRRKKRQS